MRPASVEQKTYPNMRKMIVCLLVLPLLAFSCTKDEALSPDCGADIQILESVEGLQSDTFLLESLEVDDLCLTIVIGASGCTSANWTLDMVTTGDISGNDPSESSATFLFDDGVSEFTCQAYLTRDFSFDLSPYLSAEELPTELQLTGLDTTLLIE